MLDDLLRKHFDPARARVAAHLEAVALTGGVFSMLAAALGIAAAAAVAMTAYLPALSLFVVSRIAAVFAGTRRTIAGVPVVDLIVCAALAFGFAMADPSHALAASFLLLGLVVMVGCAAAFDAGRAADRGKAAIIGASILAAVVLCCVRPQWFSLIAYAGGLVCFPTAGIFAASALARRP